MTRSAGDLPNLDGLIGATLEEAVARLGDPVARTSAGAETWARFAGGGDARRWEVRVRLGGAQVRSWTIHLDPPAGPAERVLRKLGLQPVPHAGTGQAGGPEMLRFLLPSPRGAGESDCSLTAQTRSGLLVSATGFDEPPDW